VRSICLIVQRALQTAMVVDLQALEKVAAGKQEPGVNDCWNRIGVQGDRSCPELARCTHCRNCHVYCAAGRRLLDKPVSPTESDFWTEYHARPPELTGSEFQSFTLFRVCQERFAIPTLRCVRVAKMRAIHRIPHRASAAILGIANIHGELIICVSLAALLNLNSSGRPPGFKEGKLLVTQWRDGPIAFEVDELEGVQQVAATQLNALPATVAQAKARCTRGMLSIGERTIGVLDEALLETTVMQSLA
jgi:chemotaxis-related protein WspD